MLTSRVSHMSRNIHKRREGKNTKYRQKCARYDVFNSNDISRSSQNLLFRDRLQNPLYSVYTRFDFLVLFSVNCCRSVFVSVSVFPLNFSDWRHLFTQSLNTERIYSSSSSSTQNQLSSSSYKMCCWRCCLFSNRLTSSSLSTVYCLLEHRASRLVRQATERSSKHREKHKNCIHTHICIV